MAIFLQDRIGRSGLFLDRVNTISLHTSRIPWKCAMLYFLTPLPFGLGLSTEESYVPGTILKQFTILLVYPTSSARCSSRPRKKKCTRRTSRKKSVVTSH